MPDKSNFKERKLYRSQANRILGGVCGGIAEYFDIDPTLVRLIWVTISLFGGIGVIVYIASLIIIPNNPEQTPSERGENFIKDKPLFWGSILIVIGLFLLLRQFGLFYQFRFWHIPWQSIWAIIIILIGILLLYNRTKVEDNVDVKPSSKKNLYRSKSQKMMGGVCGGLAEYFNFDVSIIRILWVIGTVISAGIGIVVYIVMLLVFPEDHEEIENNGTNI